eukprot:398049-Hanusia_phi.AAC.1
MLTTILTCLNRPRPSSRRWGERRDCAAMTHVGQRGRGERGEGWLRGGEGSRRAAAGLTALHARGAGPGRQSVPLEAPIRLPSSAA